MQKRTFLAQVVVGLCCVPTFCWAAQTGTDKNISEIVSTCGPAVVYLETRDTRGSFLGQGSGFIVDASGIIVTNFHVIQGASGVEVKLEDGEVFDSIGVIDFDARRDIAIIKIKRTKLPTLKLGDSDKVKQGQRVIAIGNPLGLERTVSEGLVSALRVIEGTRYMQISVPISPGSSGGPLLNLNGEVIGITTAGIVDEGAQNLNFAVPSNYIEPLLAHEVKYTFAELAQKYLPQRPQEPRNESVPSLTTGQKFIVFHDHGDGFETYCIGILTITGTTVSYKGTHSPHSFEMPLEAIQEVKKNDLYGADLDAFHIRLKTKSNYNFAHANQSGEAISSDPVLFVIHKALLKAQSR